jgi:hypothetical protein
MTTQPTMIEHGSLDKDQQSSPPDCGLGDTMVEDTDETPILGSIDSPFPEKRVVGCKETPFGVDLTDYPPRVITQIQATSPSMRGFASPIVDIVIDLSGSWRVYMAGRTRLGRFRSHHS